MSKKDYYHSNPQLENTTAFSGTVQNREWTAEEDKLFKDALADLDIASPRFFESVMAVLPYKTLDEIKSRYEEQINGVLLDEASHFLPASNEADDENKRKGIPWTEEEHRSFLQGLQTYGKGEWKNIAKYYVPTKTVSQVASHAQKYFRRAKCKTPFEKRRHSIHDIRITGDSTIVSTPARQPHNYLANYSSGPINVNVNYPANYSSEPINVNVNYPGTELLNQDPHLNHLANYTPDLINQNPPANHITNYTFGIFEPYANNFTIGVINNPDPPTWHPDNQYANYTTEFINQDPPTWQPADQYANYSTGIINQQDPLPTIHEPIGSSSNDHYNGNYNYDYGNYNNNHNHNYNYVNNVTHNAPLIDYASSSCGSNNVENAGYGNANYDNNNTNNNMITTDYLSGFGDWLSAPFNFFN